MQYVITGANGFIGRNLRQQLESAGQKVIAIDKTFSKDAPFQYEIDITDPEIQNLISEDTVLIHLAAISNNSDFDLTPSVALKTNVVGTQNLAEIASHKKIKSFIFASSEWIYPESKILNPLEETTLFELNSIKSKYGLSKLFSEIMLKQTCSVPTTILRFGIVYGPRENPASAIEKLTWDAFFGKKIEVKSPESSRCFIHVQDLVDGIVQVVTSPTKSQYEVFNINGDTLVSMTQVIGELEKLMNKKLEVSLGDNPPSLRYPINTKFKREFDWTPRVNLSLGIKSLLSFYQSVQ